MNFLTNFLWLNSITLLATQSSKPEMTKTIAIIFVVFGVLGIIISIVSTVLFIRMRKKKTQKINEEFQVKPKKARYGVFNFWINYVYIFFIVVGIIAALILLPIGIANLV